MDKALPYYSHGQDYHVDQATIAAPCLPTDSTKPEIAFDGIAMNPWVFCDMATKSHNFSELSSSSMSTSPEDFDSFSELLNPSRGAIGDIDYMELVYPNIASSFTSSPRYPETSCPISPSSLSLRAAVDLPPSPPVPACQIDPANALLLPAAISPDLLPPPTWSYGQMANPIMPTYDYNSKLPDNWCPYDLLSESQSWSDQCEEKLWQHSVHGGIGDHLSKPFRQQHSSSSEALLCPPAESAKPRRRSTSSSTGSGGGGSRKTYICRHKECNTAFSRQADLDRHNDHIHTEDGMKKHYLCDYPKCTRATMPFFRKDHFRDHLRDQHKEDILKRGSNANQTVRRDVSGDQYSSAKSGSSSGRTVKMEPGQKREDDSGEPPQRQTQSQQHRELADCVTDTRWWRCSRCLDRVVISKDRWTCTQCKGKIENARFVLRTSRTSQHCN